MTKLIRIDSDRPDDRGINQVLDVLMNDGVIIYPTDSVYTLGANIHSAKAYKKLCQLKGVREDKAQFSIVCSDFSHLSEFAKQISNSQFRLLKQYLPGQFTFILEASKETAKLFGQNKKTIGFRIPDIPITSFIIKKLNSPLFSASIQIEHDSPYATTADEILEHYEGKVDLIIDGGLCGELPTTIVDLTSEPYRILRQGAGIFQDDSE
jgi:tRNA threonylcarbamoyl adenosine modification protein (Sua5/YciO/YrdC/YwlC family)